MAASRWVNSAILGLTALASIGASGCKSPEPKDVAGAAAKPAAASSNTAANSNTAAATTAGSASKGETQAAPAAAGSWAADYIAQMAKTVAENPAMREANANEAVYEAIRLDILEPWKAAWMSRSADKSASVFAAATGPAWSKLQSSTRRELDGIGELDLQVPTVADAAAESSKFLTEFSDISYFRLEGTQVVPSGDSAEVELAYDLRGRRLDGSRLQDRGTMKVKATKTQSGWRLASLEVVKLERLVAKAERKPAFQEATAAFKLDQAPIVDRREAIRRGGYAVAVGDYDADGKQDVLLGNYGPVQLYRNTDKGFVDVTASVGIAPDTLVKSAAFADLDNDGFKDLVLLRFVPHGKGSDADVAFYRNNGAGSFERKGNVLPMSKQYDRAMPLTLADFDGNGTLDLYLGFPGARDFTNNLLSAKRAADLKSQGLWFNDGNWRFRESTEQAEIVAANQVYPHAVVATDLNQDGYVDLIVVDDSGRVSPVYKNDGKGAFKDQTEQMRLNAPGWSMGAAVADYDGDGNLDVVTTNVALTAGRRIANSCKSCGDETALAQLRSTYVGATLYRNRGDGTFEDVAANAGLSDVGDGAGGAEWIDYNADGKLDLYVPNGLWTGGGQPLDSLFVRAVADGKRSTHYEHSDVTKGSVFKLNELPLHNQMLRALREFKGTLTGEQVAGGDNGPTLSLGGHQRHRLFRNNGDGTFTDVAFFEGADRSEDGYVVATLDVDNDGKQDLLLRNTDPAPGRSFPSATLLRNTRQEGNTLLVSLRGHKANRDAIGAVVTATIGKQKLIREIRATSGATQSQPVAYFGLGTAKRVDRLRVRWPSGLVQEFDGVEAGRVLLEEQQTSYKMLSSL